MNHRFLRPALRILLCLVMLATVFPALTPPAYADNFEITDYDCHEHWYWTPDGVDKHLEIFSITYECGHGCQHTVDLSDDPIPGTGLGPDARLAVVNNLSEIDRIAGEHGCCENCYEDYLCVSCFEEIEDCNMYCDICHKCDECWDKSKHCEHCGSEDDLCGDCKGLGDNRCADCHDLPDCEGCGRCLVAAEALSERCTEGGNHCVDCDEDWICNECGSCFFVRQEYFCENCEVCLECGRAVGLHCRDCYECLDSEVEPCEGDDAVCVDCCIGEGNHCEICLEHVETWCDGGFDCRHCRSCAEDEGWVCEQCGRCSICFDFDFCEYCGLCLDCCMQNIDETGCECKEHCVESDDFYGEEHLCPQCFTNFSCADEFCDTCGLCKECCEMNADEFGCTCGICVEDSEFDEHICEQCGEPTCVRGDFCEDCGLCEECCLENAEAEGCTCGICVDNGDFEDPEHKCTACGAFSCSVDFCEHCGLCRDCCEANASAEYGCDHGVCPEDPDWSEHYCEECGKCKEDCGCGQPCCADAWSGWSGHGTATEVGSIFLQPADKRRSVTANNALDRAENSVTFRTRAYDPKGDLSYQWYCRRDGGAPQALTDNSVYVEFLDQWLVFVGGAATDTLTVSVPADACCVNYTYSCVISDHEGNVLSVTDEARLIGRHSYTWQWTDDDYHQQVCIGSGCGHRRNETKKEHEIGPWRYVRYANESLGAKLVRTCNVCGGVSETMETAPLDTVHTTHDYVCVPVKSVNGNGETVCLTHIRQCICGRRDGGEEKHAWDRWIVTQQANDHHRGSKYRECLLCHYRETQVIPIQTHEHLFNLHEYDAEFYRVGADNRYHWQYCGDPECEAVAFKEEHTYSRWFWQTEGPAIQLSWRDATVYRYCEVCGYEQERTIKTGNRPLCFTNADATAVSADNWDSEEKYTFTVTAKPPAGYYFVRWEDTGEGRIKYEEVRVQKKNAYGTPLFDAYGDPIYEYRRCRPYDETVVISLEHYDKDDHFLGLNTLYELDAVCERYNNDLEVYFNDGNSIIIDYGSKLTQSELDGKEPYEGEPWVLWYEKQVEDEYDYRTVTVHLRNYDGGPLALLNKGLPCDLHIIVDDDSYITTDDCCFGILGCYTGGNVTVSSPNDAELRINVRNNSKYSANCYAIKAQRDRKWYGDKVTLCGSVHLQADVTNPRPYGETYGLYSTSWAEILDDASAEIAVCSYACYDGESEITAAAIRAKKEIQLDTTGHLFVYALTDVDSGKRARPLDAKNIIIDRVGLIDVTYPAVSKYAYRREPEYDHGGYIAYTYGDGERSFRVNGEIVSRYPVNTFHLEPAYPVSITADEGAKASADGLYQNEFGDYMVRPGENLTLYTAPAPGHYDESVWIGGKLVKRGETDGVRTKYVIGPVNSALSVEVSSGVRFQPFASQPELTQSTVYYGSEAYLSYRMNDVLQVLKSHEKFSGTAALDPNFALGGATGSYHSGKLIENSITKNRVFLQRWNGANGMFENTGISFAPSIVGSVSFNDIEMASSLAACRYRLMVLYDGMEYPSEEFTVQWTDDPSYTTEARTTAVELYVKDGRFATGGRCFDGGAWVRLDSETEYLVYDVTGGDWVGRAMSRRDYLRDKKTSDLLIFAEFNYHTGVLTLNGDFLYADFDGDGEEAWYDLGGEITAIRVPDDAFGTLVVNVKADTWIEGDYDAFGWDAWYEDSQIVRGKQLYAQTDLIANDFGGVRIISSTGAVLDLDRSGSMAPAAEERIYAGIRASGDISIEGDATLRIGIGLNDDSIWWNRYGADRYGLLSEGTVRVRDSAFLRVRLPVPEEGRHMIGASIGVDSAAVELTGDSVTVLDCSADCIFDNETCYVLQSDALSVTGSARLNVTGRGDIPTLAWVDGDVLLATAGTVTVSALGDGGSTNCFAYTGELHLGAPTTLKAEYRDGTEDAGLVYCGEAVLDSDFVLYRMPGESTESGLAKEYYYSGTPYSITVNTDPGADTNHAERYPTHTFTVEREEAVLFSLAGTPDSLDVAAGDWVTFTAADAVTGYAFVGWSFEDCVEPEDLAIDGSAISFTMPTRDLNVHAVYRCIAFSIEPPYFVITDRDSTEGLLSWRVDTAIPSVRSVELEYLVTNEAGEDEWAPLYWYEDGEWHGWDLIEDMQTYLNPNTGEKIYMGSSLIGRAGLSALPRTIDTDTYKTYRMRFNGNVIYYSQPFTLDFEKGLHILLSQDRENPELSIPADYVGTECLIDVSKYLYSDAGRVSYSLSFADLFGPIQSSVCEARMFENGMLRFVRNGAHAAIYGIEGGTCITVTDEASGRSFMIPFDFGEIYNTQAYPVFVAGRKVTDVNKDDVLGDGTVSYDPETKTLTLNNATIGEIYHLYSDAELSSGAYAIASVEDITIRLLGENRIEASYNSFCHSQPFNGLYHGTVVGIGSFINDTYRPCLSEEDSFRITFTGDGSLDVWLDGEYCEGVHSIGDVTIDGPSISIQTRYSGIASEEGSFTMNAGSLKIDVAELSCVSLSDTKARFTVNGGMLHLNGGRGSHVISMSAETYGNAENLQLYDGEMILETKSENWDLANRAIYYDYGMYAVLDTEGRNAGDLVEAPATIETLDYLQFIRKYPIWVNGEQFSSANMKIRCGNGGSAVYDPATNTVYLHNAQITKGVAFWDGPQAAAGIYSRQPVNLSFSGFGNLIDLSAKDYYTTAGAPYTLLDEESEAGRYVYGIYASNAGSAEEAYLRLCGNGQCRIEGGLIGVTSNTMPITFDGPVLTITDCGGGIDGDVTALSGSVAIEAEAYSIYGCLNTGDYSPLYAYGGATKTESDLIDLAETGAASEYSWGYAYPYFRLGNRVRSHPISELGEMVSEEETETTISVNLQSLPEETAQVIVAQYRNGRLEDVRITEVAPGDEQSAILFAFGTDEEATYRVFVLDDQSAPLMFAFGIERKDTKAG